MDKQWIAHPECGRVAVTLSEGLVLVEIADEAVQRNYRKSCALADYAGEVPTDGWEPLRKIVEDSFSPAERAEIEAFIAEALQVR